MSNKNKHLNDGVIPSVGKNFVNPSNSSNTFDSSYNYTNKEIVQKNNTNSLK